MHCKTYTVRITVTNRHNIFSNKNAHKVSILHPISFWKTFQNGWALMSQDVAVLSSSCYYLTEACIRKQSLIQEPSLAKEGLFQDQIDFNQLFPSFPYISSELREDCNFHCNQSVNGVSSFCKLHSTILLISLITKRQNG